jgi:hypothetical protein
MTDRLSQLLHDEADRLDIPAVPADAALARGRTLRRRGRARTALVTAAVIALVGAGGVVTERSFDDGEPTLSYAAAYEQHGAWMADGALHVGKSQVEIDGKINAVYYTAAGVVVRTGPTGDHTSPDAGYLSLVRPDGTVSKLDPRLDDVEPGTSPDSPLIAFARPAGSGFEAVVWDVDTNRKVAAVPFDGAFEWGGWAAPPVSISGNHVYASLDRHALAINWRTGATAPLAGSPGNTWEDVAGNVWADEQSGRVVVRDLDGQPLLTVPADGRWPDTALSPDGRYVIVQPELEISGDGPPASLHEIATGDSRQLSDTEWPWGWTPDGHALILAGNEVRSCTAITRDCTTIDEVDDPGSVRLADAYYGS